MARPKIRICSFCGKKVRREKRICPSCGRLLMRDLQKVVVGDLVESAMLPEDGKGTRPYNLQMLFEAVREERETG